MRQHAFAMCADDGSIYGRRKTEVIAGNNEEWLTESHIAREVGKPFAVAYGAGGKLKLELKLIISSSSSFSLQ